MLHPVIRASVITIGQRRCAVRKGKGKRASKEGGLRGAQQDATLVLMDTLPELLKDWSTDQHIVRLCTLVFHARCRSCWLRCRYKWW